nr:unnamed protein product [Callosobruchus analis]
MRQGRSMSWKQRFSVYKKVKLFVIYQKVPEKRTESLSPLWKQPDSHFEFGAPRDVFSPCSRRRPNIFRSRSALSVAGAAILAVRESGDKRIPVISAVPDYLKLKSKIIQTCPKGRITFTRRSLLSRRSDMMKVAKLDVELTVEERNLLSVAYKNVIGARRASWRIISSIEQKEESKGGDDKLEMIRQYRGQVEKELRDICSDILAVLDKHLIPAASTGESKVFYYKMKGDYHRYLAEFATGNDRKDAAEHSLVAYKSASDIAMTELPPTHPIRFAINFRISINLFLKSAG